MLKCKCTFCIYCLTSFFLKMKNDLETQPQYCPSALCDTKYSKPEIQKILNGQPIK